MGAFASDLVTYRECWVRQETRTFTQAVFTLAVIRRRRPVSAATMRKVVLCYHIEIVTSFLQMRAAKFTVVSWLVEIEVLLWLHSYSMRALHCYRTAVAPSYPTNKFSGSPSQLMIRKCEQFLRLHPVATSHLVHCLWHICLQWLNLRTDPKPEK